MSESRILYLSRSDVARLDGGSNRIYIDAVERALRLHGQGEFVQPLKPYLRRRGAGNHIADRIIAMPAYLGGAQPVAGLKWIGSQHDNPRLRGLARASALIVLNDAESHYPVAIMEGALISNKRTAAVTAVATRYLARPEFQSLSCIGCGPIGRMQVELLVETFPSIHRIALYDLNAAAAQTHAQELRTLRPRLEVEIGRTAEAAVRTGDVVVTATVTDQPYLRFEWLQPGTFLSNVSIMDVHEDVFLRSDKVVVDDWDQCNREKKLIHQLVERGVFSRERLHAELGEVVLGTRPGREDESEIILLNPMGMAVEDVACARSVYELAVARGVGTWLPL